MHVFLGPQHHRCDFSPPEKSEIYLISFFFFFLEKCVKRFNKHSTFKEK